MITGTETQEAEEVFEQPEVNCEGGVHDYPDANFEVGPRICQRCGAKEY